MNDGMRRALLGSYDLRKKAGEIQIDRGTVDVGLRSQVTSGKHLDEVVELLAMDIVDMGIEEGSVHRSGWDTEIPGWFRSSKKWDILALEQDQIALCVELKSISSSYGNNINNRIEEALGEAVDAKFAMKHGLLNKETSPLLAYVLIVKKDQKSLSKLVRTYNTLFKPDSVFNETNYIDRFRIMCERMRSENIYGAVWFVVVDPVNDTVEEPVDELSYEVFMSEIYNHIKTFKQVIND